MTTLIEILKTPSVATNAVEVVERKGLGHPDTICDHVSEELSRALCRHYLEQFGLVLHHNVDKSLLVAGRSQPAFGGGRILEPMDIYLSGRATVEHRGKRIPVEALANESLQTWFQRNLHALNPTTDIRLHCLVRPGSSDLVDLFQRQQQRVALANDTSCGAGFAPLSELERVVLEVERSLNHPNFKASNPESGEDIKVMGVRQHDRINLTISCAFIGRYLSDVGAYTYARDRVGAAALEAARKSTQMRLAVRVNAADDLPRGMIYLTVTGTSAESGDDGQTGRGNRANGLITPFRPMTLEALAGKNPIAHVGKLYNAAASRLAAAVVAEVPEIVEAECYLVSEIGAPIDEPKLALVRVRSAYSGLAQETNQSIRNVSEREIREIAKLWEQFVAGEITIV